MASLAFDHVALPIFEVEKSLAFYEGTLGFPLLSALSGEDWGGKPWLMMIFGCADGRQLVLVALRGASRDVSALPKETRHFAFAAEGATALVEWKQRLSAAGMSFWEEDHGEQRSLYFEDPNGIVLEITSPASQLAVTPAPDEARELVERFIRQS